MSLIPSWGLQVSQCYHISSRTLSVLKEEKGALQCAGRAIFIHLLSACYNILITVCYAIFIKLTFTEWTGGLKLFLQRNQWLKKILIIQAQTKWQSCPLVHLLLRILGELLNQIKQVSSRYIGNIKKCAKTWIYTLCH